MGEIVIIGVDAAANDTDVALARGVLADRLAITHVLPSCRRERPSRVVAGWLRDVQRAVVAIDAPLGWPAPLARELHGHAAGRPLSSSPNELFRRATDRHIRTRLGKQSLDVGADRIARAAHSALVFLNELRTELGADLPLGWHAGVVETRLAVEVYPAATLRAARADPGSYKKAGPEGLAARTSLAAWLNERVSIADTIGPILCASDDPIDAVVAALAGADFARGDAVAPSRDEVADAQREGWIWARSTS